MNLSTEEVRSYLERRLAIMGNPHFKVGPIVETDSSTITADVVTADKNALVKRFRVDRRSGFWFAI